MKEWIRSEYVKCGKAGCRRCPHGPYWYAYFREDGKMRKRYLGKTDPRKGAVPDPWDAIFSRSKASLTLACEILGITLGASEKAAKEAYRTLSLLHHPDRGGEAKKMSQLNAAWEYFCSVRKGS